MITLQNTFDISSTPPASASPAFPAVMGLILESRTRSNTSLPWQPSAQIPHRSGSAPSIARSSASSWWTSRWRREGIVRFPITIQRYMEERSGTHVESTMADSSITEAVLEYSGLGSDSLSFTLGPGSYTVTLGPGGPEPELRARVLRPMDLWA